MRWTEYPSYHRLVKATRTSLRRDLEALGVRPGDLLMVHGAMRRVGPVVGGVNTLIDALFDAIGAQGTLVAYVDFEPFYEEGDPDVPVFDKRIAHAARDHGILHQALRTWPGALRSDHPDAGVAAIGPLAAHLTADHPLQYGYGEGTPLERIVQANGRVLMIGAPLDTITLLHYAEHKARMAGKRVVRYRRRLPEGWVDIEEFDTAEPVCDRLPADCFERIARCFLEAGFGRQGLVGAGASYLFEGPHLVEFAIEWLERQ